MDHKGWQYQKGTNVKLLKILLTAGIIASPLSAAAPDSCENIQPIKAVKATEVRDQSALERLRGNDGINLQWNYDSPRGDLEVTQIGDVVHLKGSQKAVSGNGRLEIEGDVLSIDSKHFIFRGTIKMIDTPDAERSCIKNGDSEFAITQNRKYWRMREFEWCDGLTDYIDIYF
jgi:hypothetical protein